MNRQVEEKLVRARTVLYIDEPFYGVLALRFELKEDSTIPTAAVSTTHIRYNPKFIDYLTDREVQALMGHEVLHPMLEHLTRREGRDPVIWNVAADYIVNAVLKNSGLGPIRGWLYDPKYEEWLVEEVYDDIMSDPDKVQKYKALDEMDESGADGEQPMSAEEKKAAELDWKLATTAAAKIAQQQGKLPNNLKRLVDDLLTGPNGWQERLKRFFTERARDDYSWSRPQRRMLPFGIVLPGLYSERIGHVVTAIDTSGSITDYMLQLFGAEIRAICDATHPRKLTAIYCDAEVNHVDVFEEGTPVSFNMHGGGGTDFRPPFQYVAKDEPPACLVYLTDGYGPFPDNPPGYPVMWVMTTDVNPPWGDVVRIKP